MGGDSGKGAIWPRRPCRGFGRLRSSQDTWRRMEADVASAVQPAPVALIVASRLRLFACLLVHPPSPASCYACGCGCLRFVWDANNFNPCFRIARNCAAIVPGNSSYIIASYLQVHRVVRYSCSLYMVHTDGPRSGRQPPTKKSSPKSPVNFLHAISKTQNLTVKSCSRV